MRHALTLLELLLVLAILGVLLALLLPAVLQARATAARAHCASNLRQIALGLHGYHDAHGSLPPGSIDNQDLRHAYWSWLAWLLPHLEQDSLLDQAEAWTCQARPRTVPWAPPPCPAFVTPVPLYACPADPRAGQVGSIHGLRVTTTSYLGVAGSGNGHLDGVFFAGSRVRLSDITDGTSHTLLVGERPPSADLWYGWWLAGTGYDALGTGDYLLGAREERLARAVGCSTAPLGLAPGQLRDPCALVRYWSLHPGGANFARADGSVGFLPYSAAGVLPCLVTRSGGETLEE